MNLKSKWICVGLSVFLLKPWTSEAVIRTVTTSNDGDPGSLRDVILTQAMAGDEIDFTNTLNGSTIFLTNRIPIPNVNFVINGPGPENLTISGNNSNQIFTLINGANISINGLTIANGSNGVDGGAILNPLGSSLSLSNCVFIKNQTANNGGAVANSGGLTIWNCVFSNNWIIGNASGGGVFNSGILNIHDSVFLTNTAAAGGAVLNNGLGFIERSTFISNGAGFYGGAIRNNGTLTVVNSTLVGNRANGAGAGGGGAIINFTNLAVIGCTIVSNSAGNFGGGIDNTPLFGTSPITLTNTIVANNTAPSFPSAPNIRGVVTNTEYNFIGSTNGATGFSASDIVGSIASPKNPLLGNLGNYGGFTETMLPSIGSTVIGAGTNFGGFLVTDQRGFLRGATTITIGAVEAVYSLTAAPGSTPQTAQTNTLYPSQLSVLLTESAINLISGVNVSYQAPAAGPSGTFPGGVIATNILTIIGFGGPGVFTANAIPGSFNVTATVTGLSPVSFALSNSGTAPFLGTNNAYNSGDFAGDGTTDILAFKGGKNGGLSLLDVGSNGLKKIQKLSTPNKGKFLAGNRVRATNYIAYKVGKSVTINAYGVNTNNVNMVGTIFNSSLPKTAGIIRASGDLNGDETLDLIGVKGKNVQAFLGPSYSAGVTISNLVTNKKLPGKVVGMYTTTGSNWVLVFQKGKSVSSYVVGTNLIATTGSTTGQSVSTSGRILGMSGATPITQKGKTITAGAFTFNNSKTNNLGKATGPK